MKLGRSISIILLCFLLVFNALFITGCQKEPETPDIPIADKPYEPDSEPESEPEPQPTYATLTFTGDLLIHKSIYTAAEQEDGSYDFIPYFSLVDHVFDSDINMLNMEGLVDAKGENRGLCAYPSFNAPREIIDAIKALNVNTLITSNNHSYDMGRDGCVRSRQNLIDNGFDVIGTYETREQANTPHIKEINGIKIGMAAFTDWTNGVKIKKEYADYTLNYITYDDAGVQMVKDKVQQLRDAGAEYIITMFHWGTEYIDEPLAKVRDFAQTVAQEGVDLIIGNHAHCVQPIEKKTVNYNGEEKECIVIYSLGNFFANQAALNKPKTQYGMVVKMKLEKSPEGVVSVNESTYSPTYMYYNPKASKKDAFRVIIAGEYADAQEKPELFATEDHWKDCKNAVEHVKKVVGSDIECREKLR